MRGCLISCVVAIGMYMLSAAQPVSAFMPIQPEIAANSLNNVFDVKARPPGWNRGRKVGWHGRGRPPGQI